MTPFIEHDISEKFSIHDFPFIVSCRYSIGTHGLINIRINTSSTIPYVTDDIEFIDGKRYVCILIGKYNGSYLDYSKINFPVDNDVVVAFQTLSETSIIATLIPKKLTQLTLDFKEISI